MIHLLYDITLWLAAFFIIPYHFVRSVQRKRPTAFAERFGAIAPGELAVLAGERPIWVHAVSVGETIAVRPFLKALKQRFPERKIVLSNVTETGRSVALTFPEVDLCLYFPFDYRFAVRQGFVADPAGHDPGGGDGNLAELPAQRAGTVDSCLCW